MRLYKLKRSFVFLLLYYIVILAFSPAITMQVEENLGQGSKKNFIHKEISIQEDDERLSTYLTRLQKYNIQAEKTFFPNENKINLALRRASWLLSWFKEDYNSAFAGLPFLQNFSLSLDLSHKELNLEELKSAVNLARYNMSLIGFTSQNLGCWSSDLEKESTQCLLLALLYRNSLIKGITNYFDYNFSLMDNPEEEIAIAEGLQNAPSLESIDLCFNEERGKNVIESIKESKSVNSIKSISFSFFDEKLSFCDLNKLNALFASAYALEFLYLEAPLDGRILSMLAEHLRRPSFTLTNLHLATNEWEESKQQLSEEAVKGFFQAFTTNKKLRLLQLCFPLSSIRTLAEAFKINNTLEILALPNENLENEEIRSLITGLKENTSITEIDFSNNNITDEGADNLLNLLNVNKTLRTLHLGGNKINDEKKTNIRQILRQRQFEISEEEKNQV